MHGVPFVYSRPKVMGTTTQDSMVSVAAPGGGRSASVRRRRGPLLSRRDEAAVWRMPTSRAWPSSAHPHPQQIFAFLAVGGARGPDRPALGLQVIGVENGRPPPGPAARRRGPGTGPVVGEGRQWRGAASGALASGWAGPSGKRPGTGAGFGRRREFGLFSSIIGRSRTPRLGAARNQFVLTDR